MRTPAVVLRGCTKSNFRYLETFAVLILLISVCSVNQMGLVFWKTFTAFGRCPNPEQLRFNSFIQLSSQGLKGLTQWQFGCAGIGTQNILVSSPTFSPLSYH